MKWPSDYDWANLVGTVLGITLLALILPHVLYILLWTGLIFGVVMFVVMLFHI